MEKSRWDLHIEDWQNCTRCLLHRTRRNVCLGRGQLPARVVVVGEAPGTGENATGNPFVGPAGHLLDDMLSKSIPEGVTVAITNLVGCIPLDADGRKAGEPEDYAIDACAPRLVDFVAMANPELIVCVGKLAATYLDPQLKGSVRVNPTIPRVHITHPAAILRATTVQQDFMVRRNLIALRDACEQHLKGV